MGHFQYALHALCVFPVYFILIKEYCCINFISISGFGVLSPLINLNKLKNVVRVELESLIQNSMDPSY